MAGSLNKVTLIGHLGADPEIRNTQSGKPIANMRIATSESWRASDGERREKTEWHTVVCFSEGLCKVIEQYVKKGDKVYIEGSLQTRKWQDQNGNDRYSTEVVMQAFNGTLIMLSGQRNGDDGGSRGGGNGGGSRRDDGGRGRNGGSYDTGPGQGGYSRDLDDDIPF